MRLTDLRSRVMPEAPGCPMPLIDRALNQAAREFCDKTGAWTEQQTLTLTDGQSATVTPNACAELTERAPIKVRMNGCTLPQIGKPCCDTGGYGFYVEGNTITVRPTQRTDQQIEVTFAVRPKLDEMDAEIVDRHAETLQAGALYALLRMSGRGWANPDLAVHYRRMFWLGIYDARAFDQPPAMMALA